MRGAVLVVAAIGGVRALVAQPKSSASSRLASGPRSGSFDPIGLTEAPSAATRSPGAARRAASLGAILAVATAPDAALAKDGQFGLAEGRIISLLHPAMMLACFGTSVYAGYTGWQWRRLREVGAELAAAKKEAKAAAEAYTAVTADVDPADAVGELAADVPALLQAKTQAEALVETLTEESTSLKSANARDVHYTLGTVLLAIGIPFAIEGPVNTYMRAGKLFPGPHVYAGAACASLWAIAAALVPHMQKGKQWARNMHVTLNGINVALFAYYQIPTGLEITKKVIEFTKFP